MQLSGRVLTLPTRAHFIFGTEDLNEQMIKEMYNTENEVERLKTIIIHTPYHRVDLVHTT